MIKNIILEQANQLLFEKNFNEALEVISKYLDEGNNSNEAYIIKAKAFEGLGRIGEAHYFFLTKINWNNPSENDLEMIKLTENAAKANGWKLLSHKLNYMYNIISQCAMSDTNKEDEFKIKENLQMLEENPNDYEIFLNLAWLCFSQNNIVKSAFYVMAYRYFCPDPLKMDELETGVLLSYFANISDIYIYLSKESNDAFAFVIEREEDAYEYKKMAKVLSLMNKKVILILPPITFDVGDNEYEIEYFLNMSYENMEIKGNIKYCTPLLITIHGIDVERTTLPLLDKIAKSTNKHLPVFAERSTLDNLKSKYVSRKEIHYMFNGFDYKNANSCTCFAYICGYEQYISKIYKFNVISQFAAESECSISIVLPVRNNVNTLPHTLKTCMEQSFSDYEIVISDNSDDGNNSVYDLINELAFDKIKYYRTPQKLPLTKSFEYAYLKARGDFLVPIGADDAVLYHGLSTINKVLKRYPDEDIFLWDRLHYVWPDFIVKYQRNQFVIPRPYIPNTLIVKKMNSEQVLKAILQFKQSIYGIPLLYINSGMKRSYLLKMLHKTGAIIDGISQDVYAGIVNLAINNEIMQLQYPITIAGLSSNSIGALSSSGLTDSEVQLKRDNEYLSTNSGNCMDRNLESIIPRTYGDISNVITVILRLIDMQCIKSEMLNHFDWKRTFWKIAEQLPIDDVDLEPILLRLLDAANKISPELYNWFAGEIKANRLLFLKNDPDSKKTYYKGFSQNQSLTIDASTFGISNVYEASKFASKLLNL